MIEGFFLALSIWVLFPLSLILIFIWISRVSIYHSLKSKRNPDGMETFQHKFRLMLEYNLYLSVPFAGALYLSIKSAIATTDIENIAQLTFIATLAVLLIQRILLNPCNNIVNFVSNHCPKGGDVAHLAQRYKENMIAFFYSFGCGSVLIFLLLESYNILINKQVEFFPQNWGHADFIKVIFIYLASLSFITFVGEVVHYLKPPQY